MTTTEMTTAEILTTLTALLGVAATVTPVAGNAEGAAVVRFTQGLYGDPDAQPAGRLASCASACGLTLDIDATLELPGREITEADEASETRRVASQYRPIRGGDLARPVAIEGATLVFVDGSRADLAGFPLIRADWFTD